MDPPILLPMDVPRQWGAIAVHWSENLDVVDSHQNWKLDPVARVSVVVFMNYL